MLLRLAKVDYDDISTQPDLDDSDITTESCPLISEKQSGTSARKGDYKYTTDIQFVMVYIHIRRYLNTVR